MGIQGSKLDSFQGQTYPPVRKTTNRKPGHLEYGSLLPQGIYPCSACDYNVKAVRLNEPPEQPSIEPTNIAPQYKKPSNTASMLLMRNKIKDRLLLLRSSSTCQQTDQLLYNHTIECPICLLTYPDCLNYTRCCDKPICTDCFLQLRRSPDSPLVPAACPFCVQPNLGVIHFPPSWSQQYDASTTIAKA
ncbi:hypothetical protein [Absidia glauca]|uniref:RING-type domain-containing protein n=1 Tax=Absidia glauca TaxID=4829 RepID=A0A163JZU9_ABSGL|nr:hypothetical protein [Absidia glauca]